MLLVTLNASVPTGGDTRYTHIWCKEMETSDEWGIPCIKLVGWNGAMVIPTYINQFVPTVLAVNADPRLEAYKPDGTTDTQLVL